VHVSELAHERVDNPNDYAAKGDRMDVKLLEVRCGEMKSCES
jgi:ribosomal protein S1